MIVTTWSKSQIRSARKAALLPLLKARGRPIIELHDDNWAVAGSRDLIIKDHYWRCTATGRCGNAIDYLMTVEGMSFNDAMQSIMATIDPSGS
jgi:hypothetical protein